MLEHVVILPMFRKGFANFSVALALYLPVKSKQSIPTEQSLAECSIFSVSIIKLAKKLGISFWKHQPTVDSDVQDLKVSFSPTWKML